MSLLKSISGSNKKKVLSRYPILLVLLSFSLSYITVLSLYLLGQSEYAFYLGSFLMLLLTVAYYYLFKKVLINLYNKILIKVSGLKSKVLIVDDTHLLLFPILVLSIPMIILFIISTYYIRKDISILGNKINYSLLAANLNRIVIPIIAGLFILISIITQFTYLKNKKVNILTSLFSALVSTIVIFIILSILILLSNLILGLYANLPFIDEIFLK